MARHAQRAGAAGHLPRRLRPREGADLRLRQAPRQRAVDIMSSFMIRITYVYIYMISAYMYTYHMPYMGL